MIYLHSLHQAKISRVQLCIRTSWAGILIITPSCGKLKYTARRIGDLMASQASATEFLERNPLQEFQVGVRKFLPLVVTSLQVDYDQSLWSVSLPFLDAVGISSDFQEARQRLFEYIDFLWNEYVLCPEEELGETGRMQRNLLLELFSVS